MARALLQRIHLSPKDFLANGAYGYDFDATRDRTRYGGDFFTCKSCHDLEIPPGRRRGELPIYEPVVFGQVDMKHNLLNRRGVLLRLICPENAACTVKKVFDDQLLRLNEILDVDMEHMGGTINDSWFSPLYNGSRLKQEDGCFYVKVVADSQFGLDHINLCSSIGSDIEVNTQLWRVDKTDGNAAASNRAYSLHGWQYDTLDDSDLLPANDAIRCDFGMDGCRFCT